MDVTEIAEAIGVASSGTTWGSDPSKFNDNSFTLLSAIYAQNEALKVQNETNDGKLDALVSKLDSVET
jgi:hypothetical protein